MTTTESIRYLGDRGLWRFGSELTSWWGSARLSCFVCGADLTEQDDVGVLVRPCVSSVFQWDEWSEGERDDGQRAFFFCVAGGCWRYSQDWDAAFAESERLYERRWRAELEARCRAIAGRDYIPVPQKHTLAVALRFWPLNEVARMAGLPAARVAEAIRAVKRGPIQTKTWGPYLDDPERWDELIFGEPEAA